jgi:hypothetical protein
MIWIIRIDWISESIVMEWKYRNEIGNIDKIIIYDIDDMNRKSIISSTDKELIIEEGDRIDVLYLHLILKGNKDKNKDKEKKLKRLI